MRERILEWRALLRHDPRPIDADQVWVRACLAGDSRAFDHLFERYQTYVYNICLGITGRPEDAQDVTQEAFLRAHRSLASFRGSARFSTWLYRIAVNCAIEHLRRPSRELSGDALEWDECPGAGDVEDAVLRDLEGDRVREALARLPLPCRTLLTLRYLQDLTTEEVAQVLGCSTNAAKVRLHRARKAFRDVFAAMERSDDERVPAGR